MELEFVIGSFVVCHCSLEREKTCKISEIFNALLMRKMFDSSFGGQSNKNLSFLSTQSFIRLQSLLHPQADRSRGF